ncbi:MAG: hypothetical protein J6M18_04995, partial [Actinomycetaceae bacterium]|nr:hypothetical protein [Actinomycetaceae bacterium]
LSFVGLYKNPVARSVAKIFLIFSYFVYLLACMRIFFSSFSSQFLSLVFALVSAVFALVGEKGVKKKHAGFLRAFPAQALPVRSALLSDMFLSVFLAACMNIKTWNNWSIVPVFLLLLLCALSIVGSEKHALHYVFVVVLSFYIIVFLYVHESLVHTFFDYVDIQAVLSTPWIIVVSILGAVVSASGFFVLVRAVRKNSWQFPLSAMRKKAIYVSVCVMVLVWALGAVRYVGFITAGPLFMIFCGIYFFAILLIRYWYIRMISHESFGAFLFVLPFMDSVSVDEVKKVHERVRHVLIGYVGAVFACAFFFLKLPIKYIVIFLLLVFLESRITQYITVRFPGIVLARHIGKIVDHIYSLVPSMFLGAGFFITGWMFFVVKRDPQALLKVDISDMFFFTMGAFLGLLVIVMHLFVHEEEQQWYSHIHLREIEE